MRHLPWLTLLLLSAGCNPFQQDKEFKPKGTPFTLNPAITVTALYGSDTGYSRHGFFNLELRGRATTIVIETLPGGLFFIPKNKETQNLIVIKPQVFLFSTVETTYVIGAFCCNAGLHAPDASDDYTIGPVTDNPDLRKIVNICADRDLTFHGFLVQEAVWQVTDGDGLTPGMEDSLRNLLPPDTSRLPEPTSLPLRPLKPQPRKY